MRIDAAFELWKASALSAPRNTVLCYMRNFRMLGAAGFETVDDLTPQRYAAYRQDALASGLSPLTVNSRLTAIVVVLRWLEALGRAPEGLADRLGKLRLPCPEPPPPRAWTRDEFTTLLEAAPRCTQADERRRGQNVRIGRWLVTFLRLGVYSGLRPGELARVEREDLDLGARPTILVSRRFADTKNHKERRVPLCSEIADYLREVAPKRGPLFPARRGSSTRSRWLNTHWIQTVFRTLERTTGIEAAPHMARKTFTTWCLGAGIPAPTVARWLGHGSLEVLYRHYAAYIQSYDPVVEQLSGGAA